jgi:hypothetical protein
MATSAERCQSICDGMMNRVVTLAEQDRLGKALAFLDMRLDEYTAATVAQKQQFVADRLRDYTLNMLQRAEGQMAAATASAAAIAQAQADFPKVP